MRAVRFTGVGAFGLADVSRPEPGPDEVLVRVEASGICGTDRHVFLGEFPSAPPVTLGHEFCGIVERRGKGVRGIELGMRVACNPNIHCGRCDMCRLGRVNLCRNLSAIGIHRDGGFAEYVAMPQDQAHVLPDAVPPDHGAFCEPVACCMHGVDLAAIPAGGSVIVLGGGVIGLLTVQLARLAGARHVVLSTRQAVRRRLAETMGATATVDPGTGDVVAALTEATGGGADVVFECAGVADTVAQAVRVTRPGGTAVILGVMPRGASVAFEPFDLLVREVRVQGSFINPFVTERAAALVASGALRLAPLITSRIGLADVAAVVAHPAAAGEVKVMVIP